MSDLVVVFSFGFIVVAVLLWRILARLSQANLQLLALTEILQQHYSMSDRHLAEISDHSGITSATVGGIEDRIKKATREESIG